jgi:ribosomal protein S18 acetylase RimI-like enzyme
VAGNLNMQADPPWNALRTRPIGPHDEEFLREVYASTREQEMALVNWSDAEKKTFLDMQFRAQDKFYHAEFPSAAFEIIEWDEASIGRLYVHRSDDAISVLDIALLPKSRRQGIGTYLMGQVLSEAEQTDRAVRIHVERFNRAFSLYQRLGFQQKADQGIYLLMEWTPSERGIQAQRPSPAAHA